MDLRIIHEFLVLAQTENYLEAADLLFVSQPTLSRHIKGLEDELGTPLFERTTRTVRLNKYGRILMPYAEQFVKLNSQFVDHLLSEKRKKGNVLSIATIPAMTFYGITSIVAKFRQAYPECRINIMPAYSVSVMEKLRQRECDFSFTREQKPCASDDKIARLLFAMDHIVAIVPKSHPMAAFDTLPLAEFHDVDIVTLPRETLVCDIVVGACMKSGFAPRISMVDHNIGHLLDCIRLGMGVGLLMNKHLDCKTSDLHDVKVIDVTPIHHTYIYLCYLKGFALSENAQAFLSMYDKQAEMINELREDQEAPEPENTDSF